MLFALLPLAGFAADISTIWTVIAPSFAYADPVGVTVKEGVTDVDVSNYTLKYYHDNNGAPGAEIEGDLGDQNVGNYWVIVTGVPAKGYEGTKRASFQITPATLQEGDGKDYKMPTAAGNTYTGSALALINAAEILAAGTDKIQSITYALGADSENFTADIPTATDVAAAGYVVRFKVTAKNGNFADVLGTVNCNIVAKDIDAAWLTFDATSAAEDRTYGDDWSAPGFTVDKYNGKDVTVGVKWYTNTACTDGETASPKNAGHYYAKVSGTGNYKSSVAYAVGTRDWTFDVDQRPVRILVNPQTKEYNGLVQAPAAEPSNFTAYGLTTEDEELGLTGLGIEKVNPSDVIKNAGKQFLQATFDDEAKIGATTESEKKLTENYDVTILTQGYIEIKKKTLNVTVLADKSISFGEGLPDTKTLVAGGSGFTFYNKTELSDAGTTVTGKLDDEAIGEANANALNAVLGTTYTATTTKAEVTNLAAFLATVAALNDGSTIYVKTAGTAGTYDNLVQIGGSLAPELYAIKAALSLGLNPKDDEGEEIADLNVYYHDAKTYTGRWAILYEANNAILANYNINPTNKDFKINGVGFTIMAIAANKIYDGADASNANLDCIALDSHNNPVPLNPEVPIVYEYQTDPVNDTWSTTLPTDVGVYKYRVFKKEEYATGNYDGKEIKCEPATLKINKKPIKVTVDDITLHVGDDVAKLNKYATYKVDATTPLIDDEELNVYFEFTDAVTGNATYWDGTKKLLAATPENSPIEKAITIRLVTDADYLAGGIYAGQTPKVLKNNGNYEFSVIVKSDLTILPGTSLAFDVEDRILDKLKDAEGTEDATVTFDNTLYVVPAGEWRTFVLPFDITPLDFCNATGIKKYCIFNKLTSANASTNTVRFSLEQKNLPANTPFLVKVAKLTDATDEEGFDLDDVTFAGRTIAAYQENPTATVSQAKFIGSWVDKNIEGGDNKMWWDNASGNFVAATKGGVAKAFPNFCFHAYLVLDESFNANEARILVEEADGSITAINYVTGEQQNFAKGAWYTINGVKVNGIPTEKGIYINNGKKVVIK